MYIWATVFSLSTFLLKWSRSSHYHLWSCQLPGACHNIRSLLEATNSPRYPWINSISRRYHCIDTCHKAVKPVQFTPGKHFFVFFVKSNKLKPTTVCPTLSSYYQLLIFFALVNSIRSPCTLCLLIQQVFQPVNSFGHPLHNLTSLAIYTCWRECHLSNNHVRSYFFLLSWQNSICHLSDSNIIEVNNNKKDIQYIKRWYISKSYWL